MGQKQTLLPNPVYVRFRGYSGLYSEDANESSYRLRPQLVNATYASNIAEAHLLDIQFP